VLEQHPHHLLLAANQHLAINRLYLHVRDQTFSTGEAAMLAHKCIAATAALTGIVSQVEAKPDLAVTQVEIACVSYVPVAPNPLPSRYIHRRCDTDHQVELSVTIQNVGDADAVLNGEIWNLVGGSAQVTAFAQDPKNLTYYPPINVTQGGPIQAYPTSLPKSRTATLKPGFRLTEVVVIVPKKQLTIGTLIFQVNVDPQMKVDETTESNNRKSMQLVVAAPPPDDEWVNCPSVGVAALVEPRLIQGSVRCTYRHHERPSEVMATNFVESKYLKPFRACLRSNEQYASPNHVRGGIYTSSMYCSFTKSAGQLVEGATGWSRSGKRVRFGNRFDSGKWEDFEICRAQYAGEKRVGRVLKDMCYIPYKGGEERIEQGFEFLVLTQAYGVPFTERNEIAETRNIQPVVDLAVPEALRFRFCTVGPLRPNEVAQDLALAPKLWLTVPGILLPGDVCASSAQGKPVSAVKGTNTFAGVMILL
jgi:hypothetical protein